MTPIDLSVGPAHSNADLITRDERVSLRILAPEHFDRVTHLRNRPGVRRWFKDTRPLDPAASREWLRRAALNEIDPVYAVHSAGSGLWLGIAGWTIRTSPAGTEAEVGRILLDSEAMRKLPEHERRELRGLGLLVATVAMDHIFETTGAERARACVRPENHLSKKLCRGLGMSVVPPRAGEPGEGFVWFEVTAAEWRRHRSGAMNYHALTVKGSPSAEMLHRR